MRLPMTSNLRADDEADMLRVKQGEVAQLDALFRRHARPLFGFFYGVCQDPGVSEDLVQEVFWRIRTCFQKYFHF